MIAPKSFRVFARRLAILGGYEALDGDQELALTLLVGGDPAREIPRAFGLRQVGGAWLPQDACVMAARIEAQAEGFDFGAGEVWGGDEHDDASGIVDAAAGGTGEIARRCAIGRRAAQKRIKRQVERLGTNGDLFFGGVSK